jgi:hypothetical protein
MILRTAAGGNDLVDLEAAAMAGQDLAVTTGKALAAPADA